MADREASRSPNPTRVDGDTAHAENAKSAKEIDLVAELHGIKSKWCEAYDEYNQRRYWWNKDTLATTWKSPERMLKDRIFERAQAVFEKIDTDGSNSISATELQVALAKLGVKLTAKALNPILSRYDQDGNGTLDMEEWRNLVYDAVKMSGDGEIATSLAVYSQRLPVSHIRRAKGYPDPPTQVTTSGDEDGCVVWWTPPKDQRYPPQGYAVSRWRLQNGDWKLKGETYFHSTKTTQRIKDVKVKQTYRFTVVTINEIGRSGSSEPSNSAKMDQKLPSEWTEHFDDASSKYYYYNSKSGARTWVRPEDDPYTIDAELFIKFTPEEMRNFEEVFKKFDSDYSGSIDKEEMVAILPRIGERVSAPDLDYLFFHYDKDESGELDFKEFVSLCLKIKEGRIVQRSWWDKHRERISARKEKKMHSKFPKTQVKAWVSEESKKLGPWDKILHPAVGRHYYHNKSTNQTQWNLPDDVKFFIGKELGDKLMEVFRPGDLLELEEKFTNLDLDGSGSIDAYELRMILEAMGEKVTQPRIASLIREVDMDGSGEIDFDEFCMLMYHFRRNKHLSGSWSRVLQGIDAEQPEWLESLREGFGKFKKAAVRSAMSKKKQPKYPHGKYCMCGCRAYDPNVRVGKSALWWLCCGGCAPCKFLNSKCPRVCCAPCRVCCWCCNIFPTKGALFEEIPEWELRRREARVAREKDKVIEFDDEPGALRL